MYLILFFSHWTFLFWLDLVFLATNASISILCIHRWCLFFSCWSFSEHVIFSSHGYGSSCVCCLFLFSWFRIYFFCFMFSVLVFCSFIFMGYLKLLGRVPNLFLLLFCFWARNKCMSILLKKKFMNESMINIKIFINILIGTCVFHSFLMWYLYYFLSNLVHLFDQIYFFNA